MAKRGTDVDLRIKRTQKAIKSAFFELLDEKLLNIFLLKI